MGAKEAILSQLRQHPRLPTPSAVALRILNLTSKSDCRFEDIEEALHNDPALCGKVLRAVNSAVYGSAGKITSVAAAARVMGLASIRSLIIGVSLPASQIGRVPPEMVQRYWKVSVAAGLVARELDQRLGRRWHDDDMVAGLLCDIGMLVMQQVWPEQYLRLLSRPLGEFFAQQCALEEASLGVNHAEVAAYILESWSLPEEIYLPVKHHHDPSALLSTNARIRESTRVLHLANLVAQVQLTPENDALLSRIVELAHQEFGLDEESLIEMLGPVADKMSNFAKLIQVDIGDCAQYAELLHRAADELESLAVGHGVLQRQGGIDHRGKPTPQLPTGLSTELKTTAGVNQIWGRAQMDGFEVDEDHHDDVESAGSSLPFDRIGEYRLVRLVGRGGMGMVFLAEDPQQQRPVAIKMLSRQLARDPVARERFTREAHAAGTIRHENVVQLHDLGEMQGMPFLVMEFVRGESLQAHLDRSGRLPIDRVTDIGRQIASGLAAAHALGLVHRDIKPPNVLIEAETGRVKITDFGLVRSTDRCSSRLTEFNTVVGTPHYMSPEQVAGDAVDSRSDLFSLGTILYVMCTGRLPFEGELLMSVCRKVLHDTPPPAVVFNPEVPEWLNELIAGLHAKDPAKRVQSAPEVRDRLASVLPAHACELARTG